MSKVKAKPYVSVFLKALKDAALVDDTIKGFLNGMLGQVPLDVAIKKMNEQEKSFRIMIEKIVEYYNKYKENGRI